MKGLSLLELLITISIVGVIFASAIGAQQDVTTDIRTKNDARRIENIFQILSACALHHELDQIAQITPHKLLYSSCNASNVTIHILNLHAEIHGRLTATNETIKFYSGGSNDPSTIRLHDGKKICTIRISLRGRVASDC